MTEFKAHFFLQLFCGFVSIIGASISVFRLVTKLDNIDAYTWLGVATPFLIAFVVSFVLAAISMGILVAKEF